MGCSSSIEAERAQGAEFFEQRDGPKKKLKTEKDNLKERKRGDMSTIREAANTSRAGSRAGSRR